MCKVLASLLQQGTLQFVRDQHSLGISYWSHDRRTSLTTQAGGQLHVSGRGKAMCSVRDNMALWSQSWGVVSTGKCRRWWVQVREACCGQEQREPQEKGCRGERLTVGCE